MEAIEIEGAAQLLALHQGLEQGELHGQPRARRGYAEQEGRSQGVASTSSRYVGVSWDKANSSWRARLTDTQTRRERHIGCYASEESAARAYDCAVVQAHGSGATRNFPDEDISELPVTLGEERKQSSSSRYTGVCWNRAQSAWQVELWDPQSKRSRHIGIFASEENAARAYDYAAVQARGPGAKRNFPGEVISELPMTVGEERKGPKSRYMGVSWHKSDSAWHVQLRDPQNKRKRCVGSYAFEEDAAKAYDFEAVKMCGPDAKRNFPGEVISELPVTVGEEQKARSSSRFIGVCWDKSNSAWRAQLRDPQTKRQRCIGCFTSEEDAARAFDCAVVKVHRPETKRNFPSEVISELPVSKGEEQKERSSSRFIGVCWNKSRYVWRAQVTDPQTKRSRHLGTFATEEDAARAYDFAAVQTHGPGVKRNFPADQAATTSETPLATEQ
ncbi:hypothetical protein FOA52_013651 [Chlamydomonas sp. UWO 241]|nr:hypothetical protein FOA52_013651 [Chlamydomonas sp. UWO 241]